MHKTLLTILASLSLPTAAYAAADYPPPQLNDILTWPRVSADVFGCMVEKQSGYKDAQFNCQLKNYVNKGNPCFSQDEYYEGPNLPEVAIQRLGTNIKSIAITWAHGEMQSVQVTLKRPMACNDPAIFGKAHPKNSDPASYKNVMKLSYDNVTPDNRLCTGYTADGFDFMDASSTDCEALKKERP